MPGDARRTARRVVAALALAAYATPGLVGVLAELSHAGAHALELARERRAVAAAFGVAHHDAHGGAPEHGGYVHTHDGVTHRHDGATAVLLAAAEQSHEHEGAPPPVLLRLAAHLPASADMDDLHLAGGVAAGHDAPAAPPAFERAPTPPPPRG
ncbi:MAG TPA: hypothetical protein VFQ22_01640 [Longimicrobiales bacterium]|nr:hypothetical protein [Longimicrobiales bacterium]